VLCTDRAALRHTDLLATAGDVSILSWPDQADLAADFARGEPPQLLLVAPDAAPPEDWNRLTDWIRLPADDRDIEARILTLQRRAARPPAPVLDDFDVLHRGNAWIALPTIEARIVATLLTQTGSVVDRSRLEAAAWRGEEKNARTLDTRIKLLRRRVAPLGLRIHAVRGRGFVLDI
jgi:hypothetical protein